MRQKRACDILLVQYPNTDYYPPTINALRVMADSGLEVTALCWTDWPETGVWYPEGVSVVRLPGWSQGGLGAPWCFARFLGWCFRIAAAQKPRVIYGCNLHGIAVAGIVGELLGIPYVHHCYDLYLPEEGMGSFDRRLKPLERYFSRRARCLVFPSESKGRLFLETSGIRRQYVVVANSPLRQPSRRTKTLGEAIRVRGGDPRRIVLYQGSIGRQTGAATLIRSIPHWPSGVVLALLGIARPAEYVDYLLNLARETGVGNRVFYLGIVGYEELFTFTSSADLGVFLPTGARSNYIFSGTAVNKVMEYMACGVPSVVASTPDLRTLMEETGAGVSVEAEEPKAIAAAVTELLTDRCKWQACAERGRRSHLEKYHFERQFKPVLDALHELADGRGAGGRGRV